MLDQNLVPIYQHRAKSGQDRYFCDTKIPNDYDWGEGVRVFYAYSTKQPGTIPIYGHQVEEGQPGPDRYMYDTQVPNNSGWKDGGLLCFAYPGNGPQPSGTIPIYRYTYKGMYYCLDERPENNYGWSFDGILCYAYPAKRTLVDEIVGILGWQGAECKGITYLDTQNNKFTLLDTPRLWDQSSTVPTQKPACEAFLDKIKLTIGSAQSFVDITLLWESSFNHGLPLGQFQEAISAGFKMLTDSNRRPLVRILVGVPIPQVVTYQFLKDWLETTVTLKQKLSDIKYTIVIACTKQSPESWNHSKIIAADGERAIVGGHNLWSEGYLGLAPVHDVSGFIEGPAVACTHSFCNELWSRVSVIPSPFIVGDQASDVVLGNRPAPSATPDTGTTRMLSLGRLGFGYKNLSVASNASVSARIMAMCHAKKMIRISQQSLYFSGMKLDGGFDFYTLWAIVKAIQSEVQVQIVVSNDVTLNDGGYQGNLHQVLGVLTRLYLLARCGYEPTKGLTRDNTYIWTQASLNPPFRMIADLDAIKFLELKIHEGDCAQYLKDLNEKLSIAPLYYSPDINYWTVQGGIQIPAANHAKVYIIDDTHFYVGSDNLYMSGTPHGLQEFGHLIEGQNETQEFISNYWDKLWKNSSPYKVSAVFPKLFD